MKLIYALLITTSFFNFANDNSYSTLNEKLQISVDSDFELLSNQTVMQRFAGKKLMPAVVFSNDEQSATITITQYSTPADKKSMRKLHAALSQMLKQAHPKATWKKDKVYNRLETRIGVYEYEIKAVGKYSYYMTYSFPVDNKLTLLTFLTTDSKAKTKWLTLAREAFDSLIITP